MMGFKGILQQRGDFYILTVLLETTPPRAHPCFLVPAPPSGQSPYLPQKKALGQTRHECCGRAWSQVGVLDGVPCSSQPHIQPLRHAHLVVIATCHTVQVLIVLW